MIFVRVMTMELQLEKPKENVTFYRTEIYNVL